jgi:hypothetical protein
LKKRFVGRWEVAPHISSPFGRILREMLGHSSNWDEPLRRLHFMALLQNKQKYKGSAPGSVAKTCPTPVDLLLALFAFE